MLQNPFITKVNSYWKCLYHQASTFKLSLLHHACAFRSRLCFSSLEGQSGRTKCQLLWSLASQQGPRRSRESEESIMQTYSGQLTEEQLPSALTAATAWIQNSGIGCSQTEACEVLYGAWKGFLICRRPQEKQLTIVITQSHPGRGWVSGPIS